MSVDDDDEFWTNEDFVATIESVVKKAEEASAARHGGTQRFAAPRPPTSSIPPHTTRSTEVSNSYSPLFATSRSYEIPHSRPANGHGPKLNEPVPHSAGPISRGYARGYAPIFSPPQQSLGHLQTNGNVEVEGLKDPHSQPSQGPNPNFLWRSQLPVAGSEDAVSEKYREILAEKDGAISLLRSRNMQAEQQLEELRKRSGPQLSLLPSSQQERELERLSAQLLFRDHEISEARRACDDKEERLKAAIAEASSLKEQVDRLQNAHAGAQRKRLRDTDFGELNTVGRGITSDLVQGNGKDIVGNIPPTSDPWSPPWMPEGPLNALGNVSVGRPQISSRAVMELNSTPMMRQDEFEILGRTRDTTCEPSGGKEVLNRSCERPSELPGRQFPGISRNSTGREANEKSSSANEGMANGKALRVNEGLSTSQSMGEIYYSLQQILGINGIRSDAVSLLRRLYANCKRDLYVLLSTREPQVVSIPTSRHEGEMAGLTEGMEEVSEKFHNALAEVANGFADLEIIIPPLLEFCKLDNAKTVGSSLRVLHCILQDYDTFRRKLRAGQGTAVADIFGLTAVSARSSVVHSPMVEGIGWFVKSTSRGSATGQTRPVLVVSSPRIKVETDFREDVQPLSVDNESIRRGLEIVVNDQSNSRDDHERPARLHLESAHTKSEMKAVGEDWILLVDWLLHLALTSSSSNVKCEALAVIGVVVSNSDPLEERSIFERLLCSGGIELFLKRSSGVDVKLQAIRIAHLLLHCPALLQKFCAFIPNQPSEVEMRKGRVLEGMAECLDPTINSPIRLKLHRSAIRFISFIAISGDSGAASLMLVGSSKEDAELERTVCGGIVNAQSRPGVQSNNPKSREGSKKGSELPQGRVVDGVDIPGSTQTIPQRLVSLIDSELENDEKGQMLVPNQRDERDCLIREAATFLCQLSLHKIQAPVVFGHLVSSKKIARLSLSVIDRLTARKAHAHTTQIPGDKPSSPPSNPEFRELLSNFRQHLLTCLTQSWEPL